ncbi:MAG: glycosyltransferase N-terminal domain-containing protein [Leeuwenhoekiella sp.]
MRYLYSFLIKVFELLLPILGIFSVKLYQFRKVRRRALRKVNGQITPGERVIWFHAASLGEYEQGVPVMEAVRERFPDHKILLTFFSPSGYNQKKNTPLADVVTYLPLDTYSNVNKFVSAVSPEIVIFIKYEFWPNFLTVLKKEGVKTVLISGVFRENQPFFKSYGKWMVEALKAFDHLFLQDQTSMELAKKLGLENVTLSGDTRYDRVSRQLEADNRLPFVEEFQNGAPLLVCGSSWPEDEGLFMDFVSKAKAVKTIIVPHEMHEDHLESLRKQLGEKAIFYSEKEGKKLSEYQVLVLDAIGFLGRLYSYADVAFVGGAAGGTGLHNILEPATFGIPILCGTRIEKFPEAQKLQQLAGLFTIDTSPETTKLLEKFFNNPDFRQKTGMICGHFVNSNTGATRKVMEYLND